MHALPAVASPTVLTRACDLEEALAGRRFALVAFETPGCEPCQALVPALEALAREYGARLSVNRVVDAGKAWVAARYHLCFLPTVVFRASGREIARIRGNPGLSALRAHVEFLVGAAGLPEPAEGPRHSVIASFGPSAARRAPLR